MPYAHWVQLAGRLMLMMEELNVLEGHALHLPSPTPLPKPYTHPPTPSSLPAAQRRTV